MNKRKFLLEKMRRKIESLQKDLFMLEMCHEYADFERDLTTKAHLNSTFFRILNRLERKIR